MYASWQGKKYVPDPDRLELVQSHKELGYRINLSNREDFDIDRYYEILEDEFKYYGYGNLKKMNQDDIADFSRIWCSNDKENLYYIIYKDNKEIGEIFIYGKKERTENKYRYRYIYYIESEYRNSEVEENAIKELLNCMFLYRDDVSQISIDIEASDKLTFNLYDKMQFDLDAEFESGERRYIYYSFMYKKRKLIKPTAEYEKEYKDLTKKNNFKEWLESVRKNKFVDIYFYLEKDKVIGIIEIKKFKYRKKKIDFEGDLRYIIKTEYIKDRFDYILDMMKMIYKLDNEKNDDKEREFISVCIDSENVVDSRAFDIISDREWKVKKGKSWFDIILIVY